MISSITPDSLKSWPNESIAVVAHDAGAARHLLSWLAPLEGQLRFCLAGPAAKIFKEKRARYHNFIDLEECLSGSQLLLSGTGWASDLEHEARKLARQKNIKSIATIDHWVNYSDRFERNGELILPDEIWVADKEAHRIASHEMNDIPILQLSNQWLEEVKNEVMMFRRGSIQKTPTLPGKSLLYLIEPQRDQQTGIPNGEEFSALTFWINNLRHLGSLGYIDSCTSNLKIKLRQHPSEPIGKYDEWIKCHEQAWAVTLDSNFSLGQSLASTDFAFGYETQALIAAIECGIPAMSCTPPNWPACRLPHKQLLHIQDLPRSI